MRLVTVSKKSDNTTLIQQESIPGSGVCDQTIPELPASAVPARVGGRKLASYSLEPNLSMAPEQFTTNLYYSPTFKKCLDVMGFRDLNARRSYGHNVFTGWSVKADLQNVYGINQKFDYSDQLQAGEGKIYWTQNSLGDEHPRYFHLTELQQFANDQWWRLPAIGYGELANYKYFVLDLETATNGLTPGPASGPALPGFSDTGYFTDWDSAKNNLLKMESSRETITLETLASRGKGAWDLEMMTRRANRFALLLEMVRMKANPTVGVKVSQGSCPVIGTDLNFQDSSGAFYDGFCRVTNIGGDADGNITLEVAGQQRRFKLDGDCYSHSDFLNLYVYEGRPYFADGIEHKIFDEKSIGKDYPSLWGYINIEHRVAHELALIELNEQACLNRFKKKLPLWRQMEPFYEFFIGRSCPFPEVQNVDIYNNTNFLQTPRVWQPPYMMYTAAQTIRFRAGEEELWGYYLFPYDFQHQMKDPATFVGANGKKFYNHAMHTVTAIYQGFADLQPYETFFPGSTYANPQVQLLGNGAWKDPYTAAEANNRRGGVQKEMFPVYRIRYKAVLGGWMVLILGGMQLDWTQERTDIIRLPGVLNNNRFQVKLRGPASQVFFTFVSSTDVDQLYTLTPTGQASWEKPGYGGRINSSQITTS